jgi:monofunctional glycosyltransferase
MANRRPLEKLQKSPLGFSLSRLSLGVLLLGVATVAFLVFSLPDVSTLKNEYPVVRYLGPEKPPEVHLQKIKPAGWVTLREISPAARNAVLISEDWAFYQHHGVDWNQLKEAAQEDWEAGEFLRGASTLTQQVVRNIYLSKNKNLLRKAKEFYLALEADQKVGKHKILETYLNIVEWGPGVFGIRAASNYYFKKSPAELNAQEGAFLAMLLPSPLRYGESFRKRALTPFAASMIRSILEKMVQAKLLTAEEMAVELARPLAFE